MSSSYVYRFLDSNEAVIYVGVTKDINRRIKRDHFSNRVQLPKACYDQTNSVEYCEFKNSNEAAIYEIYFIDKFKPKFNKMYNENKTNIIGFPLPKKRWAVFNSSFKEKTSVQIKKGKRENIRDILTKDILIDEIVNKGKSLPRLADEYGTTLYTINSLKKSYNLDIKKLKDERKRVLKERNKPKCEICNEEFDRSGNRQRFCKDCGIAHTKKLKSERNAKYYRHAKTIDSVINY